MELAKGFQLDLSRALQLEQLKLAFGITDALAVMSSDDLAHENAVDDDDDDENNMLEEMKLAKISEL